MRPSTMIRRAVGPLTGLAVLALVGATGAHAQRPGGPAGPVPVSAATAQREDVPVYLRGLGTVQAYRAVTVRARVDGAIDSINFTEGQEVKPGDLLVQIDPRPYQAALDQALAKKAADEALLDAAKADLERYTQLTRTEAASKQKLENIRALTNQLTAAIQGDEAAIATAKLNLDYTRITSPIEGRVGLRLVDQGNFVRQAESQGIVTITQHRPISVLFTLPQDSLPRITAAMARGPVRVVAYASDDATPLAEGTLLTPDNAIDATTGTIRLKAVFGNDSRKLWPGQFVHARLLVETKPGATVVPSVAVQRGQAGLYVYVVQPDGTVAKRDVEIGTDNGKEVIVTSGVKDGEQVVTGGHSRLAPGAKVIIAAPGAAPGSAPGGEGSPAKSSGS